MAETPKPDRWPLVVGVNHCSSSMVLRDRLFMEDAEVPAFLECLREAALAEAGDDAEKANRLLICRLLQRPSEVLRRTAADDAETLAATERLVRELCGLDYAGGDSDKMKETEA
ncbi:MAG: hypothetical protein CFH05_01170 [Alphaproteobacteria bacterium MarineAlpha3_Bin4]|nr:MAG: hypothetical protein CFH05_01170 [Alphaproteobacteria bacterium MarineAlpha3_Bin4]